MITGSIRNRATNTRNGFLMDTIGLIFIVGGGFAFTAGAFGMFMTENRSLSPLVSATPHEAHQRTKTVARLSVAVLLVGVVSMVIGALLVVLA